MYRPRLRKRADTISQENLFEEIASSNSWPDLSKIVESWCDEHNIPRFIYTFMPPESLIDISISEMHHSGYEGSEHVLDMIRCFVFPEDDIPLIHLRALDRLTPYFGNDANIDLHHRRKIEALPAQINAQPRKIGLNIPVYGPRRRMGMFSFADNPREKDPDFPRFAQSFCQPIHQRYCEIWDVPKNATRLLHSFTPREMDVMHLVVQGRSNAEIAEETSLSKHTVDSYLRRVYMKLGVNNRVSAALKTIELGLLNTARA